MNRLPPETQKQLKKMSFTCLVLKLGKAGFDTDRLKQLGRTDLLEAMAETMLAEPTAEFETDLLREAREAFHVLSPREILVAPLQRTEARQSVSGSSS